MHGVLTGTMLLDVMHAMYKYVDANNESAIAIMQSCPKL
jgi:hypothetical protein